MLAKPKKLLVAAAFRATIGALIWVIFGTNNVEAKKHILYSLGAQDRLGVFKNEINGEVIRLWGTPIYDQWSGLGNRLPTQGFLTNSPLGLLANFFTLDLIIFLYIFLSLWFAIFVAHEWINGWVTENRKLFTFLHDMAILGLTSFYTIFHEWSVYVIQISGAIVCVLTLTGKSMIQNQPNLVANKIIWRVSLGFLMIGLPHIGYGMTYFPAVIFLTLFSLFKNKRALLIKIWQQPLLLPIPILVIAIYMPAIIETVKIRNSIVGTYAPEFGLFKYWGTDQSILEILNSMFHTMIYPVLGIFIPEGYLSQPTYLRSFAYNRTNFAGGVLLIFVFMYYFLAWKLNRPKAIFHIIVFFVSLTFFLQYVDLTTVLDSWPTAKLLLSNGHWQYADLSLILVFTCIGMIWDHFFETNNNGKFSGKTLLLILRIGMLFTICLLPFRIFHTVLANNGTPRFSASHILNHETRQQNEGWIDQFSSGKVLPQRILVNEFIQPEGQLSWFGLRYIEQLRDTQIAPLQARVKTRGQSALNSSGTTVSVDPYFNCNTLDTADRLDFLSVTKFISENLCNKTVINRSRMKISLLPVVKSNNEAAMPAVNSLLSGSTQQLKVVDVDNELYLISPRIFHEWYYNPDTPRSRLDPLRTLETTPCPFLEQDCIKQLELFKGSVPTDKPRFKLCKSNCLAHFEYSAEYSQKNFQFVLPISYDTAIVAFDVDSQKLQIENFHGLVGINTFGVSPGEITISIAPDSIMHLNALAPILFLFLIFYIFFVNLHYQRNQHRKV
jgi:hypothetical protein